MVYFTYVLVITLLDIIIFSNSNEPGKNGFQFTLSGQVSSLVSSQAFNWQAPKIPKKISILLGYIHYLFT